MSTEDPRYAVCNHSDDPVFCHVRLGDDELFDIWHNNITGEEDDAEIVKGRAALDRLVTLANATLEIHAQLTGRVWSGADDLQEIGETLERCGLTIAPPEDEGSLVGA